MRNNISIFATLALKRGFHENMNLIVFYIIKIAKHTKPARDKFSHLYIRNAIRNKFLNTTDLIENTMIKILTSDVFVTFLRSDWYIK